MNTAVGFLLRNEYILHQFTILQLAKVQRLEKLRRPKTSSVHFSVFFFRENYVSETSAFYKYQGQEKKTTISLSLDNHSEQMGHVTTKENYFPGKALKHVKWITSNHNR